MSHGYLDTSQVRGRERTHISVELIILCREDHLPQVFTDAGDPGQVDPVVVKSQELMDHGLVRPLKDKTRHTLEPKV